LQSDASIRGHGLERDRRLAQPRGGAVGDVRKGAAGGLPGAARDSLARLPERERALLGTRHGYSSLLQPYPPEEMEAWPVATVVSAVRNDGPELIARLEG